ncbi:LLM class F420-dependent oxidoreductase [soil metagenome]
MIDVGVQFWPSDRTISVPDLARALEERGFASLWVSEHTHAPISRNTPWPKNPAEPLPMPYMRMHDPLIALAAAAVVTERLTVATGILLAAQRDPIITAKEVASIDHLSGGRFIFGVGYGWDFDELRSHGVDPARRKDVLRENVEVMRELWSHEVASHSGEFYELTPSWQWPKPLQRPGPPVVVGAGKAAFREIAAWSDGWVAGHHAGTLTEELPLLRQRIEEAGRKTSDVAIHSIFADPFADDVSETIDAYEEAGAASVILFAPPWVYPEVETPDGAMRILDRLALQIRT